MSVAACFSSLKTMMHDFGSFGYSVFDELAKYGLWPVEESSADEDDDEQVNHVL